MPRLVPPTDPEPIVRVEYRYRDASNYKCDGRVDFRRDPGFDLDEARRWLDGASDDGAFFAHLVGLPESFPWRTGGVFDEPEDGPYHFLVEFDQTRGTPTDPYGRTFATFRAELAAELARPCFDFDPSVAHARRDALYPAIHARDPAAIARLWRGAAADGATGFLAGALRVIPSALFGGLTASEVAPYLTVGEATVRDAAIAAMGFVRADDRPVPRRVGRSRPR